MRKDKDQKQRLDQLDICKITYKGTGHPPCDEENQQILNVGIEILILLLYDFKHHFLSIYVVGVFGKDRIIDIEFIET